MFRQSYAKALNFKPYGLGVGGSFGGGDGSGAGATVVMVAGHFGRTGKAQDKWADSE